VSNTVHIDPQVHYVGASFLRKVNATFLRNLRSEVYVLQNSKDEPLQVLIGYEQFMQIQATHERLTRELEELRTALTSRDRKLSTGEAIRKAQQQDDAPRANRLRAGSKGDN
jgi:hypothetical protein